MMNFARNFWQEFCIKWGLGDKEKKRLPGLMVGLMLGVALLLAASAAGGVADYVGVVADDSEKADSGSVAHSEKQTTREEEERLADILGCIKGAGRVEVSISYVSDGRTEYAVNYDTTVRTSSEQGEGASSSYEEQSRSEVVLLDGSSRGLAVESFSPKVQGVLVVTEGGSDPRVCRAISDAVQNLLGVPAHKIVICTME